MATVRREAHTAEEIQAEVHRRIHEGEYVKDDGAAIRVPLPTPMRDGAREPNGSNWTMSVFGNATGYEAWVMHCYYAVQTQWDLKD